MSHRVTMIYVAESPHTGPLRYSVEVDGDGDLDQLKLAFEAFVVALGYTQETAREAANFPVYQTRES